jgi:hypothetical protein
MNITFLTGIWDLGRSSAPEGWNRSFDHYISSFIQLLKETNSYNINLMVFIDPTLENLVWEHRSPSNTRVYHHSKQDFNNNFFPFFDTIQKIRNSTEWQNQAVWLKDSSQGNLEYYNPMVMSKMFLLHNAKIFNPFDSEYFFWIDGGISNTVSLGYFDKSYTLENIKKLASKFLFICFPYETNSEIHGFSIEGMKKFCQSETVNRVARGGFFGGHKDYISQANNLYYTLLQDSLNEGYMGTEESIFTIMTYLDSETYNFEMINDDGLLYSFFEKIQNESIKLPPPKKISLYINTFNSPEQLQMVLDSFERYEPKFLEQTHKILINNTTKPNLFAQYENIINKYEMIEIRKGNIGICGGRQLAAEHFNCSESEYMLFFEDDMLLDYENECAFGFKKRTDSLYNTIIKIMDKEKYDFLKLSFSEFYGHNGDQWSWHNVPQEKRVEYFGNLAQKPYTLFNNIKTLNQIPYADGEIYYSNWPHIISRSGNQKMFLDTKWNYPYEQTWMSHIYTLTKENKIKPAVLLASPITHNRMYHYEAEERKEN